MQSFQSLDKIVQYEPSAFYITDASPELLREIQTLLKIPVTGVADDRTKEALSKFKSDRNMDYVLSLGAATAAALLETGKSKSDLANCIVAYMKSKNYKVFEGERLYNIVYLEGADEDGTPNADTFNEWNDRRILIEVINGNAKIVGNWLASCEPGSYYTYNPMNPGGAARIAFGQYTAWQVGIHGNSSPHEALIQTGGKVTVHRDFNKDGMRVGDKTDTGFFGINHHWGYNLPKVNEASAGCPVAKDKIGHQTFMAKCKQDKRYLANKTFIFTATFIAGDDLNFKPVSNNRLPQCGVELIKQFEGCYLDAYPDPLSGGKPITIGWGCTKKQDGSEWKFGERITQQQADDLLVYQLLNDYLPDLERTVPYWESMNEFQKGALLSFAYNLGSKFMSAGNFNSMRSMLQNRDYGRAQDVFPLYRNPGTNVEQGLLRRRIREAELFLK